MKQNGPEKILKQMLSKGMVGCIESRKWRLSGRVIDAHSRPSYPGNPAIPAIPAISLHPTQHCSELASSSQPSKKTFLNTKSMPPFVTAQMLRGVQDTKANKILVGASGNRLGQAANSIWLALHWRGRPQVGKASTGYFGSVAQNNGRP